MHGWPVSPVRYTLPEAVSADVEAFVTVMPVNVGVAGIFQVWAVPEEVTVHKLPPVVVANVCVAPVRPFKDVIAAVRKAEPLHATKPPAPVISPFVQLVTFPRYVFVATERLVVEALVVVILLKVGVPFIKAYEELA